MPFLFVNAEASADASPTNSRIGNLSANRKDKNSGLSDIVFIPIGLNWAIKDFQINLQLPIYAPTGEFTVGRLTNLGKNHWTFDPILGANWFNPKIGLEVTAIIGFAMSTKNPDTDYQNGVVFHSKGTIAQYLPLGKSTTIGVGCNWIFDQQITGDSGSGARLGSFQGRIFGVGPSITLLQTIGKVQLYGQVKWLPEIEVQNRLQGSSLWVSGGLVF